MERENQNLTQTETAPEENKNFVQKNLQFFDNFQGLYNLAPSDKGKKHTCIIMPTDKWKIIWDFYIVFLLLLVSVIVPFRLAFKQDSNKWLVIYTCIDTFFFIDMIVTFFTALIDPKTQIIELNKAKIAKDYLKFWFWIDIISSIPYTWIFAASQGISLRMIESDDALADIGLSSNMANAP